MVRRRVHGTVHVTTRAGRARGHLVLLAGVVAAVGLAILVPWDRESESIAQPHGVEASEVPPRRQPLEEPPRPSAPRDLVASPPADEVPAPPPEPLALPGPVFESDGPPTCPHDHGDTRPRTPYESFRPAYEGHTLQDLLLAKTLVEQEFFDMQNRLVAERLEAGLFETYVFDRVDDFDISTHPSHAGGGLIHSRTSRTLEDGRVESRLTFLPYDEYPHLYAKQDELFYLHHLIREQRSASTATTR